MITLHEYDNIFYILRATKFQKSKKIGIVHAQIRHLLIHYIRTR